MTLQIARLHALSVLAALTLALGASPEAARAQEDVPKPSTFKMPVVPKLSLGAKPDPSTFKQGVFPKVRPTALAPATDTKADGAGPVFSAPSKRLPPPGVPRAGGASSAGASTSSADSTSASPGAAGGAPLKWQQGDDPGRSASPETPRLGSDFIKNCVRLRPNVRVHLDIYDEELESVVKLIACMTGKNIILPKSLKGAKITIYSPSPVNSDEAYKAFLSALEANGKTISEKGKFLQIIEIKDYVKSPDPLRPTGSTPPNEDRMVTQIVPLKNVDAQEMNDVLSKLASPNASFIVYAPSNALIITETGANLRKLLDLLEQLDVPGGKEQLWVYQVLHAEAGEISSKITEIFGGKDGGKGKKTGGGPAPAPATAKKDSKGGAAAAGGAAASASVGESDQSVQVGKVIADERTNRLLIVATARSYKQIKDLIAKLDVPIEGDGQVHIHRLNHAKAEDLANVLSNLSQNAKNRQGGGRRNSANKGKDAAGGAPAGAPAGGGAALFEGDVQISADDATNALVITSSFKDFISMKRVIEQLDQPRRQVFLEAVVMEVSVGSNREVDLSLHNAEGLPLASKPGKTNSLALASADGAAGLLTAPGLSVLAATGKTSVYGVDLPSFGAVLRALASSNNANILSTPSLLTTDNAEAEIVVGNNVPFPASGGLGGGNLGAAAAALGAASNANTAGLGSFAGLFGQQIQRQDVALTLKITPRVNASNFVTLEVDQVVEDIENPDTGGLGPTTAKRSIKTTVVVKDQQTVVIGGLQKNKQSDGQSKVPILGEIPVIGYFFRSSTSSQERRNLVLMITPHVIEGPEDFQAIFKRKLEEHREFEARFRREGEGYIVGLDYGKKHGALEAIRQSVRAARKEEDLMDEVRRQQQGPPLPQDVDGVPLDSADGPIHVPSDGADATSAPHDGASVDHEPPVDAPPAPPEPDLPPADLDGDAP